MIGKIVERVFRTDEPVPLTLLEVVEECPWCGDEMRDDKCSRRCSDSVRAEEKRLERQG